MGAFYHTFLDRWPPAVAALSMPTRRQTLSEEDVQALLSQHPQTRELIGSDRRLRFSGALRRWIDQTVALFPGGAFARLGTCSFVTPERGPRPARTGEQVVKLLMHPGARAASLTYRCFRAAHPVALCVREWRDIAPGSEFRIFIRNRTVVGVSQYHWRHVFPDIEAEIKTIADALRQAASCLTVTAHLQSVVADVYLARPGAEAPWVLIELNPYSPATGAGLFTWDRGGDFDGTLRYRAPNGDPKALPLCAPGTSETARGTVLVLETWHGK